MHSEGAGKEGGGGESLALKHAAAVGVNSAAKIDPSLRPEWPVAQAPPHHGMHVALGFPSLPPHTSRRSAPSPRVPLPPSPHLAQVCPLCRELLHRGKRILPLLLQLQNQSLRTWEKESACLSPTGPRTPIDTFAWS